MKIKAPIIEIDDKDPFKNDKIGRKDTAEALTEIIKSLEESVVFSINSTWGTGKTTFLKMWKQMLIN